MRFNSLPSCTLFAKVSLKRTPYANTPVAIRVIADTYESVTANKAQFVTDLNLDSVSTAQIELVIANFKRLANAEFVSVAVKPAVAKYLKD